MDPRPRRPFTEVLSLIASGYARVVMTCITLAIMKIIVLQQGDTWMYRLSLPATGIRWMVIYDPHH